jgi:hypothetical protein
LLPEHIWGSMSTLAPTPSHTRCSTDCQRQLGTATRGLAMALRRRWPIDLRGGAPVPRSASTHGQGPSLDLYAQRAARRSNASGCGSARRGWPKAMPWPRDGVRGPQSYKCTHGPHPACSAQPSGNQRRGAAAHESPVENSRHDGQFTDKHNRTATASTRA